MTCTSTGAAECCTIVSKQKLWIHQLNEAISFNDIINAQKRLKGHTATTPLLESALLNKLTGRRVLIKAECLQHTGSFKFRGGTSAITNLTPAQRSTGVIAYSSGNHAQGVAFAAQRAGVKAVIVMPCDAPKLKINNTREYGAEIVIYDRPGGESREAIGQQLAEERGLHLIKPYDNKDVIAGQGTCGLEIAAQAQDADIDEAEVLVCCGGGGLTSGIALSLETTAPKMKVRPVEPKYYDDVIRSQKSGQREQANNDQKSICDAIVTPSPGELTFPIIKRLCHPGIVVTDEEALQAMQMALRYLRIVAEPGGAVAMAAALFHNKEITSDTVICVVSGGNVDPDILDRAVHISSDNLQ